MRYLVTGGAGFIGSYIVEELVKCGEVVRVLDNFATGKRENIKPFSDRIELVEGDIRDPEIVRNSMRGIDIILHQAALPSIPRSIKDPVTTNEVNVTGALNLFEAARKEGIKRIVCASSSSIYGKGETLPKIESLRPQPMSPYATSKLAMEYYAGVYHKVYGLDVVCLRYFNVFGPRQDPESQYAAVIPLFIHRMMDGKPPVIFGDGTQSRDFSFVENIVSANLLASEADEVGGMVINIACGERYTILELMDNLNRIMGLSIKPQFAPSLLGDVKHSQADLSLAERFIGYHPIVPFPEGLKTVVTYYQKNS